MSGITKAIATGICVVAGLSACGHGDMDGMGPGHMGSKQMDGGRMGSMMNGGGMMGMSMLRHRFAMHNGIPDRYASKSNPLPGTAANHAAGAELYQQVCASCHGPNGRGDGPAGAQLDPPPADIAGLGSMPMASDGYLYWTIAEGGAPVGSSMPRFGSSLSEQQTWQLILYLRRL